MKVLGLAVLILAAIGAVADAGCNPREECSKHCILRNPIDNRCTKWQSDQSCEARKAQCHTCMEPLLLKGMSEQSAADRC